MAKKLTEKQEKFCQVYHECGNKTQAFMAAFAHKNMKEATINNNAYKISIKGEVKARMTQLRNEAAERHNVTIDSITKELEEARDGSIKEKQYASAVSASLGKAKLHGLIVDKAEVKSDIAARLSIARETMVNVTVNVTPENVRNQLDE